MKPNWRYTPENWLRVINTWLARHDNLPLGCLAKHLKRILYVSAIIAMPAHACVITLTNASYANGFSCQINRSGDCAYVVERSADMVTWQRASWFVDADEAWFYDATAQRMFYRARVVDVNEPLQ